MSLDLNTPRVVQIEPHLVADGIMHKLERMAGAQCLFRLNLPVQEVRLVSGSARPAEVMDSEDWRRLGVALREVTWRQGDLEIEFPMSYLGSVDGFYHLEQESYRWTDGDAALPFPDWHGEATLCLVINEWEGSRSAPRASHDAEVMGAFESLGDNCEFGFAQRKFDLRQPLTAFRWSSTDFAKLMDGLARRFEGVGDPAKTEVVATDSEYRLTTPYFNMHTWHGVSKDPNNLAVIHAWGATTLRLLRRKLLHDLAEGQRIFVFKTEDPGFGEFEMRRLHSAVREIGPAKLLCVRAIGDAHRGGQVDRIGDGLYAGYLSRFVLQEGPYDEWYGLCSRTLAMDLQPAEASA